MKSQFLHFVTILIVVDKGKSQDNCGKHKVLQPAIIGGTLTIYGEHPWKAALMHKSNREYFCGGSLVSNKVVVTAAHCIEEKRGSYKLNPKNLTVALGVNDLSKSSERGRRNFGVSSIHVHPDWNINSDNYDGDIAVLILNKEVTFSTTIQPICLSKPQSLAAKKTEGIVIAFGFTENRKVSDKAKKLVAPIRNYHNCVRTNDDLKPLLSARTFCGGPGDGNGVCIGDSGSGLYVLVNDRFYLRGITSASTMNTINECDVNTFGIFADTTDYCGWIQSGGINKYAHCPENEFSTTTRRTIKRTTQPTTTRKITTTVKPIRNTLYGGEYLNANEYLQSPRNCFKAYYQTDGNFAIYRTSSGQSIWSSKTDKTCPKYAIMQGDGNFVVYDCNNLPKWSTETDKKPGARIVMQDDGNLVVYGPGNAALWSSRTVTPC